MKSPILYLAILIHLPFCANSQNWQWANKVGSNIFQSYDYGRVITDGSNYYLTGWYSGTLYLQTDTFYSLGNNNMFIIKYDSNGNEIWARNFGGNGNGQNDYELNYAIYDSVSNSIYISGEFAGIMTLGNVTLSSNPNYQGLFVCKMDLNGNFLWAHSIVNTNFQPFGFKGNAQISCSPKGILYLTGALQDTISLCGNTILPGGFLLKFDSNGNCFYARNLFTNPVNRLSVDFLGDDLILSGNYSDPTFTIDTVTLSNPGFGTRNFYICKTDSLGNAKWIRHFGFGGEDAIGDLEVDHNISAIYFCGGFQDSIQINGNMYFNPAKDILFGKLDTNGNTYWIKQTNGSNNIGGASSLAISADGNIYSVGYFSGSASFGNYTISTSNTLDMFLTRYNSNGDFFGVKHFGYADGSKVVVDSNGFPVCSGGFFNTVSIGSTTLTSNGYVDVYLAKSDVFTGIVEGRITNNELLIFANPNQGQCNITIPDEFANENSLVLRVFDQSGKLIQELKPEQSERKIRLDLEAEAKGTYHVTLSNSKKSYHGKLILQ